MRLPTNTLYSAECIKDKKWLKNWVLFALYAQNPGLQGYSKMLTKMAPMVNYDVHILLDNVYCVEI